ncbi:MAG: sensor histidine kinase KdpD [Acidimicrobiaceae bacterium]|nr:sensor histidine kinase KdpD [Acidimicrobiaceae bacterium]
MARGLLRVYLGSAPGVGKTYRMLDEGYRRRLRGTDVVIGYVETHQRPNTDAQIRDLEVVARVAREYRGAELEEMDVEAILRRAPEVALVDELAHTNVPGSTNEKRWQDVEALLEAGIDVITTVNIQHLESVNDVVDKITGITQQETVPDAVVRRAEQIELVDVTPEALRRRMAHGNIYAADKIDASLSNYFRVGNLGALRELALLWLADRVEDALQQYQDDHDIDQTWETRERLIVGVAGTQVDETLLRRAARIASRTGAELYAVHVVSADGLHGAGADMALARGLVDEFEGQYQEIVDDNVANALVAFARSERGTQILLGASRAPSAARPFGGVVEKVLRHSQDLDVHVIAVRAERPDHVHERRQNRRTSWFRRASGLVLAAVSMPLLTLILTSARSNLSLSTEFLCYLVLVLALATWGGVVVGLVSAVCASALENYYFVPPLHTLRISRPNDVVSVIAFLVFAAGASVLMSRFTRRSQEAERARAEAQVLAAAVATAGTSHDDLLPLLDSLRAVFDASSVALLTRDGETWRNDVVSGPAPREGAPSEIFPIDDEYELLLQDVTLDGEARGLVSAFSQRVGAGLRVMSSAHAAAEFEVRAENNAARSSLLRSVSHDLRDPLTTIQFKVAALLDGSSSAPALVQRERLEAVDVEVKRLTRLINNLIDVGRLETGGVAPQLVSASLQDLLEQALSTVDIKGRTIDEDVPSTLPRFTTDPSMAERAIAIVVGNALQFGPVKEPVRIAAGALDHSLELLVIDRGPGMSVERREAILDPTSKSRRENRGVDLGLTVASSFVRMLGGDFRFEDTPGGGLTVVMEFPLLHVGDTPGVA